jgi:hypothetical protein
VGKWLFDVGVASKEKQHQQSATAFFSRLYMNMSGRILLLLQLCLVFFTALTRAATEDPLVVERPIYHAGDAIPVTCRMSISRLLHASY